MDIVTLLQAALLGVVEGLTEFIPVSSTGHLILLIDLLGFAAPPGKLFEICIQFGAILAVCVIYRQRLWDTALGLFRDATATRFAVNILVAFLPAAVVGVLARDIILDTLFNPWVVSMALIAGGIAILLIERHAGEGQVKSVDDFTLSLALRIGVLQCLSMIPGVSRSGATIMGSRLLGVQRAAATEFSFFLAIPTMLGATVYSAWKSAGHASGEALQLVAVGFVLAFLAALVVVRSLLAFVSRHGFQPFAWYRIALGSVMLVVLTTIN